MFSVILLAGGKSTRFGQDKIKALLGGVPLFLYSLSVFLNLKKNKEIGEIIIVSSEENLEFFNEFAKNAGGKITKVVLGGKNRQNSVLNGVKESKFDFSIIHNFANPFVSKEEVLSVVKNTKEFGAAAVGRFVKNTVKIIDKNFFVKETLERESLFEMETPQGITNKKFIQIIEEDGEKIFTDDVSVFESKKLPVKLLKAKEGNFKITTQNDLKFAESLLKADLKIGIGHDSHKFSKQKSFLIIGGVKIEENYGFEANSDGDLVFHSLCNAIGTAIGEGSLSLYADEMCKKGIKNSGKYLEFIKKKMIEKKYIIGNISISIEGKKPKLEKHIFEMKKNIAEIVECNIGQIGIACTTGEGLSSFGKGEGLQCFVNVVLRAM